MKLTEHNKFALGMLGFAVFAVLCFALNRPNPPSAPLTQAEQKTVHAAALELDADNISLRDLKKMKTEAPDDYREAMRYLKED